MKKGYTHLYTGDGKGKTTAALGLALRAAGAGFKVWIAQFAKGKEYSEHVALKRFEDLITLEQFGKGCFIYEKPNNEDIQIAKTGLATCENILSKGLHEMVILDEVCIALHYNLFSVNELLGILEKREDSVEVVLTGRRAPQELVDYADLVTEMREVKHYYTDGVDARKGIEM